MTCCAILTDSGVGGTFLAWSWHWLKGDDQYYHVESDIHVKVFADPLTKKNSHKFLPNQPLSLDSFNKIFANINKQHIYFHNFKDNATSQAIERIKTSDYKTVVVTKGEEYALYSCSLAARSTLSPSLLNPRQRLFDDKEILLDKLKFFSGNDYDYWTQQNLTNIWDLREFIALTLRPLENNTIKNCHQFDFEYFNLPAIDVWKSLDKKIVQWFDYCEVAVDQTRLESWLQVYRQWQQLHIERINFCENFETIINGILTNQDIDLAQFGLDIVRESAIQHALIYRHNLNFKTWQLEKFENTKQLHNLLEPNIHPIKQ